MITNRSPLIAVIDDDDPFLDLLRDILEGEGYRVTVGRVLDGALALLRAAPPDLLVLDLTMGTERAAGLTLLRALRADPPFARLPIIVASAATDLLTTHAAAFAHLDAVVLAKPFDLDHLIARVGRLTGVVTGAGQEALPESLPIAVVGQSPLLMLMAFAIVMRLLSYH